MELPYERYRSGLTIDEVNEYFSIFEKVIHCPYKYNRDIMRVPVTFYVKGTQHEVCRGVMACLTLKEALQSVFPHIHDSDTRELLPEFSKARVKLMGMNLEMITPLYYLYETFKSITGTLYLTLVV